MSEQPSTNVALPIADELDPAQAAMAEALRLSFRLLKWMMIIVVVFYLFSGLFRVKPGDRGFVLRFGELKEWNLGPGWHWSWPFPIDEVRTASLTGERSVIASFMWQLTEMQKLRGIQPGGSTVLRPGRDDYLLTGDLGIIHAELKARYVITDPQSYLTNVVDVSPEDENPAEWELMHDALAAAAIEVASRRSITDVYVDKAGYLSAVTEALVDRLRALEQCGRSTGIAVRGVVVTSIGSGNNLYDSLMPPLSVLAEFDAVQRAEQEKGTSISQARGKAAEILSQIAGPEYEALASAIEAESAAQYAEAPNWPELRAQTEKLLAAASGEVRSIIKAAEGTRSAIVSEAAGDADAVQKLAAQFEQNPELVRQRLRLTLLRDLWEKPTVSIRWVPEDLREIRLMIPRDAEQQQKAAKRQQEAEEERRKRESQFAPTQPRGKFKFEVKPGGA